MKFSLRSVDIYRIKEKIEELGWVCRERTFSYSRWNYGSVLRLDLRTRNNLSLEPYLRIRLLSDNRDSFVCEVKKE